MCRYCTYCNRKGIALHCSEKYGLRKFFSGPKNIKTEEILENVWRIEGYLSDSFFKKPPSSNIYILLDGSIIYIVDTGYYSIYKKKILEVLNICKMRGGNKIRLLLTQAHFDHSNNNDVVLDSGLNYEFYLPEDEVEVLDSVNDFMKDIRNLSNYENPLGNMTSNKVIKFLLKKSGEKFPDASFNILKKFVSFTMKNDNNLKNKVLILLNKDKIKRRFNNVNLYGWNLGRYLLIHDGAHSPGHICIYDEKYKLILLGDVTIEINPAFFYSSMKGLINYSSKFYKMARDGFIECVGDSHRSLTYFKLLQKRMNLYSVNKIQLIDYALGQNQCMEFLNFFKIYYSELRNEVLKIHSRLGITTVDKIVNELYKSDNEYVKFKIKMVFPKIPSRIDVLVAQVLKEEDAVIIRNKKEILIKPK